jgi:hypothetical protein
VLGIVTGDSEEGHFWIAFSRHLRKQSVAGVQLLISDALTGSSKRLTAASRTAPDDALEHIHGTPGTVMQYASRSTSVIAEDVICTRKARLRAKKSEKTPIKL